MIATPLILTAVIQTIWIVDSANGPGTNFTSIQPAVTAAVTGDVVIVRSGSYAPFTVSGKALTIRGAGVATTTVAAAVSSAQTVIGSVPTGAVFYLGGIGFVAPMAIAPISPDPAIRVSGPGEVVLSDASLTGFDSLLAGSGSGNPALAIDGGAVVHVTRCSMTGGGSYLVSGGTGAIVGPGCKLAADASTFTGGVGWYGFFSGGGHGVLVQGGSVTLSRCSAYGGSYGIAGSGVRVLQSGFARIAGTAATVLQGGTQGGAPYSVFADAASSAIVHGPVTLLHPTSGPVTTGALPLPYASITGTPAGGGELQAASSVTVTFEGLALAAYFCMVETAPSFSTAFSPLLIGELLVPVPLAFALEGTLPASGSLQFSVTPLLVAPSVANLPIYLQIGVVDSVAGNIRMSNGLVRVFKN